MKLVKYYFWICLWGCFWKLLVFEWMGQIRKTHPHPLWVGTISSMSMWIEQKGKREAHLLSLLGLRWLPPSPALGHQNSRFSDLPETMTWTHNPLVKVKVLRPLTPTELHSRLPSFQLVNSILWDSATIMAWVNYRHVSLLIWFYHYLSISLSII